MRRGSLRGIVAVASVSLLATVSACSGGGDGDDSATTLTVYTDQHPEFIEALTDAYSAETGTDFQIQEDATVGQVKAEGDASPADVFLSEDPGPAAQLGKAGLLSKLDDNTLDQIQPGLSSPKGLWAAYAARTRVLYYNPDLVDEDELPESLLDITDEEYDGEFAYAPSGAFVATTQYLISTIGKDKTKDFLESLKDNGVNEHKNGNVRDTVEAGKHPMGLSNHYYWWIKANETGGPDNMTSEIYHFPEEDAGNLILSSGAGILESSDEQSAAADFVQWLTAKDGGQEVIANAGVDESAAQYPVARGSSSEIVGSLDDIASPEYDMSIFADQEEAEELLKNIGLAS